MAEWSIAPDSKSGVGQPTVGSNPILSANSLIGKSEILLTNSGQEFLKIATLPSPKRLKLSAHAARRGITVRRVRNVHGGTDYGYGWLVVLPAKVTGGKRLRKQFKSTETKEAVNFAEGAANKAVQLGQTAFSMSVDQQVEAEAALKRLLPHGVTLREAVDCAILHLRPAGGDISFKTLLVRLLAEKARKSRRTASIGAMRFYIGALVRQFGDETLVKSATPEALREWVDSLQTAGASPRHVLNHVSYAKLFFRYALAQRFVGESPASQLEAPHIEGKPPSILTLPETRRLLTTSLLPEHLQVMPAVVLGLFCGLRTEEIARLRWEHVDLKRRKITISPEVGKNRRATDWRYPVIPKGAVEFLQLAPQREGPVAPPCFQACLTAMHLAAKFENWRGTHSNAKRHSFGSYACALHGADWTVGQMGNSVRMLVRHYQNTAVTKRQANEYFGLTPESIDKSKAPIIQFPDRAYGRHVGTNC